MSQEYTEEETKTFWGHLEDLRWSLMRVVAVLFVGFIASFAAMREFLFDKIVMAPTTSDFILYRWIAALGGPFASFGEPFSVQIINIKVTSQFMTHISMSFWFALLITFPYLIFEIWRFIQPALFREEKRNIAIAFVCGTGMFFLGCLVGYLLVFPLMFRFLAEYQLSTEIANQISLTSYTGNFLGMIFVMGIVFELPLLTWLLSRLGLVNRKMLQNYRRHAVVALLVLSAIITPSGDPFTLFVVFLPLYMLYEVGIFFARKAEIADDNNDDDDPLHPDGNQDKTTETTPDKEESDSKPSSAEKGVAAAGIATLSDTSDASAISYDSGYDEDDGYLPEEKSPYPTYEGDSEDYEVPDEYMEEDEED